MCIQHRSGFDCPSGRLLGTAYWWGTLSSFCWTTLVISAWYMIPLLMDMVVCITSGSPYETVSAPTFNWEIVGQTGAALWLCFINWLLFPGQGPAIFVMSLYLSLPLFIYGSLFLALCCLIQKLWPLAFCGCTYVSFPLSFGGNLKLGICEHFVLLSIYSWQPEA